MIDDRLRKTYRELEASKRQVIDGSAQVIIGTQADVDHLDRGVSPVLALATTRAVEVTRRGVVPLGTEGSNSGQDTINDNSSAKSPTSNSHRDSTNSNTSEVKTEQARTGGVPVRGIRTGSQRKTGRGRIRTRVAAVDINHDRRTPTAAAVEASRGRRYARRASSGP